MVIGFKYEDLFFLLFHSTFQFIECYNQLTHFQHNNIFV